MRTTLIIDDEVITTSKKIAHENGETLSQLVTRALRELCIKAVNPSTGVRFIMPEYGSDEPFQGNTPSDFSELRDEGR